MLDSPLVEKQRSRPLFAALAASIAFIYAVQFAAIATALVALRLTPWLARAILVIGLAVACVIGIRLARQADRQAALPIQGIVQKLLPAALCGVLLVYLILWATAYIAPDLSIDGNYYHIPTLSLWDSQGYIHWIDTTYLEPLLNGYPKGMETVTYVVAKALNSNFINTANLIFLPLGVLGIASIANQLGSPALASLSAGAAFVLVPVNIQQSQTAYVDTAYASTVIAFVAMALHASGGWRAWSTALALGAAMALMLSVKGTGVALAGIGLLVLTASCLAERAGARRRRGDPSMRGHGWSSTVRQAGKALLVVSIVAFPGAFWYIRNLLMTGTPLYPVGVSLFGQPIFPGLTISMAVDEPAMTPPEMQNLSSIARVGYAWAQGLGRWPWSLRLDHGYDSRLAGLGFLWLVGCVPAILAALTLHRRRPGEPRRKLLLLLAVVGIGFLATPLNWWARFTVWIYALGLPCLALVATEVSVVSARRGPVARIVIGFWLAISVGLLAYEGAYSLYDVIAKASPASLSARPSALFDPENWEWPVSYLFPDMSGTVLEQVLLTPSTVAIGPRGNMDPWRYAGYIGQLSQPLGERRLVFLDGSGDMALQARHAEADYVVWDPTFRIPPALTAMASRVDEEAGYRVLKLSPAN